ncbi:MAG: 3-oxoacyl-[acyl-carrier-protein] reductase [Alphaproteobacteria bacterium RIFCSPLOWO2_01_FULL_40_26]|nr:MAG: 3-oxoacyl-[acyl-carrier-protein] reductase [Alphaproteobacteria bacterium RIFCSPHIGHO2_02_FULL_40_34]OFW95329.1 MAG: 3-oxoacyl-[acyl-carrier-protein] reductase [Alphaproteobacteria bacterium RIFCSPLOWO2_01_FULL_40_26]OFX09232.1 MAG: 3-oxoacyl-[acyl-carrier-protein] reductase [Alphaproteobacteria bacterium RIFCSPLOWO2_02_FULL_40_19]OFX11587.1 MAG: 3-oxoacyl-[acyl-carrier-protein] reductase [Alphaproteobacteria bacterium RIFCSPLOWO2_12_FULL_40_11]
MFRLTGKNALITGATGGIGAAIAKALARQGAKLVLSSTREEKLQELANEISGDVKYVACNLSDAMAVDALFDKAEELAGGQIDILVCNAGITKDNLILRMKDEDFNHVLDVNLKSTFVLNRNAIKKMMRRKYGRIINIASVVGITGNPGQCNYVASKAGMIGMSKSLAQEVASRNITINCVAPGFIQSPMTDILNEQQRSTILSKIPAGKMGDASDIAKGVAFLASEDAGYITGHTLHINGGMFMS